MHLTAKFDHLTFSHSEIIMRTNKQTNTLTDKQTLLKTSTSLRYATPVGNKTVTFECNMLVTTRAHSISNYH